STLASRIFIRIFTRLRMVLHLHGQDDQHREQERAEEERIGEREPDRDRREHELEERRSAPEPREIDRLRVRRLSFEDRSRAREPDLYREHEGERCIETKDQVAVDAEHIVRDEEQQHRRAEEAPERLFREAGAKSEGLRRTEEARREKRDDEKRAPLHPGD